MSTLLQAEAPPMRRDEFGALRIGETRLLVDLVLRAFQDGATPEAILQRFPAASLAEIYGVIGYYLRHRDEMEQYLALRAQKADATRAEVELRQGDQLGLRQRLMDRQKKSDSAS